MKTEKKLFSLTSAFNAIDHAIRNVIQNGKNPDEVPFIIKEDYHAYPPSGAFIGHGEKGFIAGFEFHKEDEIITVAPDSRPEGGGEYWASRGPSSWNVSGFVKSKLAGERLLRLVKYILETDDCYTWLDFREREPLWIQFKFSNKEFDVQKLHEMAEANSDIVTEEILRKCVRPEAIGRMKAEV